jgi:hypothetical protein
MVAPTTIRLPEESRARRAKAEGTSTRRPIGGPILDAIPGGPATMTRASR